MCDEKQSQSGDIRVKIRQLGRSDQSGNETMEEMRQAKGLRWSSQMKAGLWVASAWLLVSCATTQPEISQQPAIAPEETMQAQAEQAEAERIAAEEARREEERRERVLQEEVDRLAREQAAAEAAREQDAADARRAAEARRRRQQAQAEQAARVAEQEARIAELEAQLANYDAMIARQEQENARLEDAVLAAEDLLQALTAEQGKYDDLDANGQPVEPLNKTRINELELRAERLINEAQSR